jgi:hypothetical protein
MNTSTKKTWTAAKNLILGDVLESKTGKFYKITKKDVGTLRTVVLLDDDLEVDFENYHQLQVIRK